MKMGLESTINQPFLSKMVQFKLKMVQIYMETDDYYKNGH